MNADDFNRTLPYRFGGLMGCFATGQSDERDRAALVRPLPREQRGILTNRAKIRWQPVAYIDKSLRHRIVSCTTVLRFPLITRPRKCLLASMRPLMRAAPCRRFANCASLDC